MSDYPEDEYSDVKSYTLVDIVRFPNSGVDEPDWKTQAMWKDTMHTVTDKWADLPQNMRKDYYISVSYDGIVLFSFKCFNVFVPYEFKNFMRFSDDFIVTYTS